MFHRVQTHDFNAANTMLYILSYRYILFLPLEKTVPLLEGEREVRCPVLSYALAPPQDSGRVPRVQTQLALQRMQNFRDVAAAICVFLLIKE